MLLTGWLSTTRLRSAVLALLCAIGLLAFTAAPAPAAPLGSAPLAGAPTRIPDDGPSADGDGPVALGYSLATTTLGDGSAALLRWNPCQVISYRINVAAVPSARRAAVAREIHTAVDQLSAATRLSYRYAGTTTAVPQVSTVDARSELVIAVTEAGRTDMLTPGLLGYGGYHYWTWRSGTTTRPTYGAAIARGVVVVDVDRLMTLHAGFGPGQTRGNVFLHELAHTVGLEHVEDSRQLAYPALEPSAPSGYAPGDRAGLALLGRAAGCVTVPASVVRDLP